MTRSTMENPKLVPVLPGTGGFGPNLRAELTFVPFVGVLAAIPERNFDHPSSAISSTAVWSPARAALRSRDFSFASWPGRKRPFVVPPQPHRHSLTSALSAHRGAWRPRL